MTTDPGESIDIDIEVDRPTWIPLALIPVFPFLLVLVASASKGLGDANILLALTVMLLWFGVASGIVGLCIGWLAAGFWRRAFSAAVFPLVTAMAVWHYVITWQMAAWGGEFLHFYVERSVYLREVEQTPRDGRPLLLIVSHLGALTQDGDYIVFDEADELSRLQQSDAWKAKFKPLLDCPLEKALPAGGHFYIGHFACDG